MTIDTQLQKDRNIVKYVTSIIPNGEVATFVNPSLLFSHAIEGFVSLYVSFSLIHKFQILNPHSCINPILS